MNKDQLLDAIGMVDEQKIHDAAMIRRTKWLSGSIAAVVVLLMLALPTIASYLLGFIVIENEYDYSLYQLTSDIDNAYVVTVYPDNSRSRYTIYVPDDIRAAMRFDEWTYTPDVDPTDRESLFALRFSDTWLHFYDDGYVYAEKHDWDSFVGVYTVPEELWQELSLFLANNHQ